MIKNWRSLFAFFLLTACAAPSGLNMAQYGDADASPSDFIYCHGYSCSEKIRIGLHDSEWKQVKKIFKKKSKSPEQERRKIAQAVAKMERLTAGLAGTQHDLAKAPIIKKSDYELDCIDETVNTTHYLTFFEEADLFQFHNVGSPAFKGFFVNGVYPHNTATVIEKKTGDIFVIDSYIYANGKEPVVRSLNDWMKTRVFEREAL